MNKTKSKKQTDKWKKTKLKYKQTDEQNNVKKKDR